MIKYREGYKNQIVEDAVFGDIGIYGFTVNTKFIELTTQGKMTVRAFYAWDGASGPTVDRGVTGLLTNTDEASLAHDALYELMRRGHLPQDRREAADKFLDSLLMDAGMWKLRRWYWLKGLSWFGDDAADETSSRPILTAP